MLLSPLNTKALLGRCQSFFLHSLEGTTLINTPFSSALLPGFQAFSHSSKQDWMNFYLCEIVHSRKAALEKMNTVYVAGCCGAVHPVTKRHQTPFFMKIRIVWKQKLGTPAKNGWHTFRELLLTSNQCLISSVCNLRMCKSSEKGHLWSF